MANVVSRTLSGFGMLVLGIVLFVLSIYSSLLLLIYSIPLLILGIWILLNRGEDKIEKIKYLKGK
jgi:NhaP-type Na+/H+ and K+/H+ antiporter